MGLRTVAREWEWEFTAAPEALWPVLADTARFNEAAGLPRYAVTDLPEPDGTVRRIGRARRFGITVSWEEGVPQWIVGRRFVHERRFAFVLFGRVVTEIGICPASGGGSRVRYRLSIAARGRLAAVLLRFGFLPAVGTLFAFEPAPIPRVRWESGVQNGSVVTVSFDPLLAKVIAHGEDRDTAIARMRNALAEMVVEGIKTNIPLHQEIFNHSAFKQGGTDIHYLERRLGLK